MYTSSCNALTDDSMSPVLVDQLFNLRYRVFHQRLGWAVRCIGRHEIDQFDDGAARYVLVRDASTQRLCGSWRLRPTTQPYMLSSVFPELLDGHLAPRSEKVWEISRLCVETHSATEMPTSFNAVVMELMRATAKFATEQRIHQFVAVTTPSLVRLLALAGIPVVQLGKPRLVGVVTSLACRVDFDSRTRAVISNISPAVSLREAA